MKPMWKEGLFVMPQHFQLMERYQERLLEQRLDATSGFGWGVSELQIDEDELARGLFQVTRCTAVMPDGLLIRIGPQHPTKAAVVMAEGSMMSGSDSAEIYLAVPSNVTRGTPSYASAEPTAGARFTRVLVQTNDAYGIGEEAEVECVRPNAQLMLGSDERRDYVTIKIAELRLGEAGTLEVSDDYIPPLLKLQGSKALTTRLARLANATSAKRNSLAERYRGRADAVIEFGATEMATFWYLHTVNSWLPTVLHHAGTSQAHPEQLFLALSAFAGQLSTFDTAGHEPQALPRYEHHALASTFQPLFDYLHRLLGTVVAQRHIPIPLEQSQRGLFVGRPTETDLLRRCQLFLVASAISDEVTEATLREELPRYVKIAALDQIADIVQAAITGVEAQIDLSPPPAIPVKAGQVYLRLQQHGPYWDGVIKSGSVAIYQPIKPSQVELKLLAVEV